jgi:parallel beta-helix repeat protein
MVNTVLANGSNNGLHASSSPTITMVHCTIHGVGQDGLYLAGGSITLHNTILSNPGRYAIFRSNNASMTESNNLYHGWGREMTYGFTPASPVLGDPNFVNAGTLEFGVRPGSAARNAGMNASAYTTVDRVGALRPQGTGWDIGAYEGDGISRTIYVRTSGSDSNSGRTPARAYRTIQRAIQEATDPGYTIHVGPGTYAQALLIGTGAGAAAASGTASEPNRLVADTAGTQTGDPPGPVVISGNNRAIARGLFVSGRSHWHAEGFRFTGHGQTAVQVSSGGMTLTGCTVDVPPNYGVLMQGNAPMSVSGNVFNFAADSGHTVVIELLNGGSSTLRIENNRMHDDGDQYLASSYRTQVPTSFNAAHTWRYAIYAFGQNNPGGSVIVRNNIMSDKYVGIYGTSNSSGPLIISNNTITGCSWSIYTVGGPAGSVISNNIISSSYYGAITDGLAPVLALCEHDLTFPMSNLDRRNFPAFIITSDPRLADPRAGSFALVSGSACIDAGTEMGATSEDIAGNPRPTDGRGDGVAAHDLGAMEEVVPSNRVRVVRWREVSPVGDD